MSSRRLLLAALMAVLSLRTAYAAAPSSITVQGRLTDTSGAPLPSGIKAFQFRIFDAESGGTQIWPLAFELHNLTTDADGLWSAQVGIFAGLTDSVFADTVRWLEITVDGTVLPRVRLRTGPYAHRVATIDGASGGTITSKVSIGTGHINTGNSAFVTGSGHTATGEFSSITGGSENIATGGHAVVGGGRHNRAYGDFSVIGGGGGLAAADSNQATADYSVISGGSGNNASGFASVIGGGENNRAGAVWSTVAGGYQNAAFGDGAVVAGGLNDSAMGHYSFVAGGIGNKAAGAFSFAAGWRAKALHNGSVVWAGDAGTDFASTGANQFLLRADGGVGINTNAPYEDLTLSEASSIGFKNGGSTMLYIYESGGSNPTRPIIGHSPGFSDWGLAYVDASDEMIFQRSGLVALDVSLAALRVGVREANPSSVLDVDGSLATAVRLVTTNVSLNESDYVVLTTENLTVTLPDAATCPGRHYVVKKVVGGAPVTVSVAGGSGDLIDGAASLLLTVQYMSYSMISDGGNNWYILD